MGSSRTIEIYWPSLKALKNWRHYLESCKHEVLVLADHNVLRQFGNTKSESSRQDKEETLRAENTRILHRLRSSLANTNISGVYTPSPSSNLAPLYQVLSCETHVIPPFSVLGCAPLQAEEVQSPEDQGGNA